MNRITRVAALVVVGAFAACRPAEPVRLGFVGGLSGRVADLGVAGRNGAQLAVESLNAEPNGPRYELLVEDDRHDTTRVREAVASLAQRHVAFAVGPMTSTMALAASPEVERLKLVMISPTASTHEMSGRDDHFFRVVPDTLAGARQLVDVLHARGLKAMAVLMDFKNRSYAEGFGHAAAQRLRELGGQVTLELPYESGAQVEYAALAHELAAMRPELVLMVCSAVDAALVSHRLRSLLPRVGLAMSAWALPEQLLQLGGRAIDGAYVLQPRSIENASPAFVEFKRRYQQRFGEDPNPSAVSSYDATMLGVQALRLAKRERPLRDVLAGPGGSAWAGLQGPIKLDQHGDNTNLVHLTMVREGRLVPVAP